MEFKHFPAINNNNEKVEITIASGPVIIENNKVLLVKHKDPFWKFPGGTQLDTHNFIENAKREVKEELNINVTLQEDPYVMAFERNHNGIKEYVILIHYLAKKEGEVKPGEEIEEYKWFNINDLPKDCAPNIKPTVDFFKEKWIQNK
ncbi:MAG: NUDIX hydrolase [Candidatus Woesearchaeota archaeon]